MKLGRVLIIVVVVVVILLVGLYAYEDLFPSRTTPTAWSPATSYPVQVGGTVAIAGQQCVTDGSYIYCIGGQDGNGGPRSEVYSSPAISSTSANITSWTSQTAYPEVINGQSCVVYSGHIYCVGGSYDVGGDDVASSYYANATKGTVGTWNATTAYPTPIDSQSCVASSGYIYCIGGNNETDGTNADSITTGSVWFAQLSPSGIGNWTSTNSYPTNLFYPTCSAYDGYVYCVGGADVNNNPVSATYYAPLSSSGVGAWTETTAYPEQESGLACGVSSGYIYCVGGQGALNSYSKSVYAAPLSSSGIGNWKQGSSYPNSVETSCVVTSSDLYCVGGFDSSAVGENGAVYYVSLANLFNTSTAG